MGTRSLTVFNDEYGKEIAVMYRQFDGYPSGHGTELAEFLTGKKMVNGFNSDTGAAFNGSHCLAASVVAEFKDGIGSFYLHAAGTRDVGEEYIYTIDTAGQEPIINVYDCYAECQLYTGTATDFLDWAKGQD